MVIVRLKGGLGNQMFQYALGLKLRSLGREVRFDLRDYRGETEAAKRFQLPLFGVSCPQAAEAELRRFGQGQSLAGRIERKLGRGAGKVYEEDLDAGYQPQVLEMTEAYLDGYWQTERYFRDIRGEVLRSFVFPALQEERNRRLLSRIRGSQAVSVHIRRGDYLAAGNAKVYQGICTLQYYQKAIEYLRKKMDSPLFFFFSDDPAWVRENFCEPDMVLAEGNTAETAIWDMYLMTQCKANIVANSSFSWWGAWLNENSGKLVVSPARWQANHEVLDFICDDWIRMGET